MNENYEKNKKQKIIKIFTPISNKQNITYSNYTNFCSSNKIHKPKVVSFNDSSINKLNLKQFFNSNKKDSNLITFSTLNASNTLLSNNNTFLLNSNKKNVTNRSIIDSFNSTKDEIKTNKYKHSITNFSFNSNSNEKNEKINKIKKLKTIKDKKYELKNKIKSFIKDLESNHKNKMNINKKIDLKLTNFTKKNNLSFEKLLKQQKKKLKILNDTNTSINSKTLNPTNHIEMNKIIINGFGFVRQNLTQFSRNYTKRFHDMNSKFYNILENMKLKKFKLHEENFKRLKNYYKTGENYLPSKEVSLLTVNRDDWEQKYFKKEYKNNKMSENNYKHIKNKYNKIKNKKIENKSKNLANCILNIDLPEYENIRNRKDNNSFDIINLNNLNRIIRLNKILKNKEDTENDELFENMNEFKRKKKEIEFKVLLAINSLGQPKYVKNKFRNKTITKYNAVSGNNFF